MAVSSHILLPDDFGFDESKAVARGNQASDGRYFSSANRLDIEQIAPTIMSAIKSYDSVLRLYLGDGYLINDALIWRNYSIPPEFDGLELFSQHWHYDRVVDFRNIQLFVLLGDVSEDDGPLEFVVSANEHDVMRTVIERNNVDLRIETRKFTGIRGDSLLFSTGSTPHRAGIPKEGHFRDMFSVCFFPAYSKIGKPFDLRV